jgi:hypothetical protein
LEKKLKRFATHFLATTCLTVAASAVALGTTITEPGLGSGPGFGTSFPGTQFSGVTTVYGDASTNNGTQEFYEFQGLPGSVSLGSISFQFVNNGSQSFTAELLTDTEQYITSGVVTSGSTFDPVGIIPADGNVIVDIMASSATVVPYTLTLFQSTPEPGTLAVLGLGLAGLGAAGLRRRLRKS